MQIRSGSVHGEPDEVRTEQEQADSETVGFGPDDERIHDRGRGAAGRR